MNNLIAANPFGSIVPPAEVGAIGTSGSDVLGKLLVFTARFLVVGAAIYALFNLILAGYSFMSAGDDAKKVAGAWAQIYQTLMGLAFAAGAFVLAAIFGQLLFGKADFILNPVLPTL